MAEDDDGLAKGSPRPLEKSPVEETSVGLASVDAADENAPQHALECGFTFFLIQDSRDEDGHTFGKVEIEAMHISASSFTHTHMHTAKHTYFSSACKHTAQDLLLLAYFYVLLSMHRHDKLLSLTAIYISRVCVCIFVYTFLCTYLCVCVMGVHLSYSDKQ